MAATPPDIDEVLEQVRAILVRWQSRGILGEVAVVVGGNQYEPQERPVKRHKPVKRARQGSVIAPLHSETIG